MTQQTGVLVHLLKDHLRRHLLGLILSPILFFILGILNAPDDFFSKYSTDSLYWRLMLLSLFTIYWVEKAVSNIVGGAMRFFRSLPFSRRTLTTAYWMNCLLPTLLTLVGGILLGQYFRPLVLKPFMTPSQLLDISIRVLCLTGGWTVIKLPNYHNPMKKLGLDILTFLFFALMMLMAMKEFHNSIILGISIAIVSLAVSLAICRSIISTSPIRKPITGDKPDEKRKKDDGAFVFPNRVVARARPWCMVLFLNLWIYLNIAVLMALTPWIIGFFYDSEHIRLFDFEELSNHVFYFLLIISLGIFAFGGNRKFAPQRRFMRTLPLSSWKFTGFESLYPVFGILSFCLTLFLLYTRTMGLSAMLRAILYLLPLIGFTFLSDGLKSNPGEYNNPWAMFHAIVVGFVFTLAMFRAMALGIHGIQSENLGLPFSIEYFTRDPVLWGILFIVTGFYARYLILTRSSSPYRGEIADSADL